MGGNWCSLRTSEQRDLTEKSRRRPIWDWVGVTFLVYDGENYSISYHIDTTGMHTIDHFKLTLFLAFQLAELLVPLIRELTWINGKISVEANI